MASLNAANSRCATCCWSVQSFFQAGSFSCGSWVVQGNTKELRLVHDECFPSQKQALTWQSRPSPPGLDTHASVGCLSPGCPRAAATMIQGFQHPANLAAAVTSDIQETASALLFAESELWVTQKGDTKSLHNHFKPSLWSNAHLASESG